MNGKKEKSLRRKMRKGFEGSFIIFLNTKPKWLPLFLWQRVAKLIFNEEGIESFGGLYGIKKHTVKVGGVIYKIKQ